MLTSEEKAQLIGWLMDRARALRGAAMDLDEASAALNGGEVAGVFECIVRAEENLNSRLINARERAYLSEAGRR